MVAFFIPMQEGIGTPHQISWGNKIKDLYIGKKCRLFLYGQNSNNVTHKSPLVLLN